MTISDFNNFSTSFRDEKRTTFTSTPFSFHIGPTSLSNINNFQENYNQSSNQFRLDKSEKLSTTDNSIPPLASTTNSPVLLSPTTRKNNLLSLSTTSAKKDSVFVSSITNSLGQTIIDISKCHLNYCSSSKAYHPLKEDELVSTTINKRSWLYELSAQNALTIVKTTYDVTNQCGLHMINCHAIHIHCVADCLDLAVHDLIDQYASIANCIPCVKDIIDFIRRSPKRLVILKEIFNQISLSYTNLTTLCPTTWTMRAESYGSLLKTYEQVQEAFYTISKEKGGPDVFCAAEAIIHRFRRIQVVQDSEGLTEKSILSRLRRPPRRYESNTIPVNRAKFDKLIRLYLTIPITTATSERAFSALNRVKNTLRSSMTQSRLNHCLLAHIYKEKLDKIDPNQIMSTFISSNEQRQPLLGLMF
ncbi:unnamed protein product [Rotaria sordida]|uniref:HAT C-terminal dimerisation domain-containing protein n=2 Tax=Rotaria sordida TaxID=392033 RepID=A0A819EHG9_9BILA|nr:unnamed protein product [Rotaria sordida]